MSEKNSNQQNQSQQSQTDSKVLTPEQLFQENQKALEAKDAELQKANEANNALRMKLDALEAKDAELKLLTKPAGFEVPAGVKVEVNEHGLMTGNQDKKGDHPFDPSWNSAVVVRQSIVSKIGEGAGDVAEIPSSVQIAVYEPAVFDALKKTEGFKGSKIVVLHDPRK